jgi:hypothetical protein
VIVRSILSLEYVRASVAATEEGVAVDPTGDPLSFAFIPQGDLPTALTTFTAGSWEVDDSDVSNPVYYARILVGPGGTVTLAMGEHDIYLKVVDNPEVPVRWVDTIRIV